MSSKQSSNQKHPVTPAPASASPEPEIRVLLPAGVEEVLALFEGELSAVAFPDVNAKRLREAIAHVATHEDAVEAARAALTEAESRRGEAERAVIQLAEKGLAYARVFAAGNPELSERLKALPLGKPAEQPGRIRKPRKARKPSAKSEAASDTSTETKE